MSDNKNIVFITGANAGIGLETVKALLQSSKPYHVLLGSRSVSKGEDAATQLRQEFPETSSLVEVVQIDVTVDDTIDAAFHLVESKFGKLDVLINNAGVCLDPSFAMDSREYRTIFNETYNVNVTGSQVMTYKFAPLLIKSSNPRLLFLTSGTATLHGHETGLLPGRIANIPSGWPKEGVTGAQSYKTSKTALNMLMITWHWLLKEDGVKTWSISPGFVATNLLGDADRLKTMGAGDPAISGDLMRKVIEGERDEDVGRVVFQNGVVQAW